MRRFRSIAEYGLARLAAGIVPRIPRRALVAVARATGALVYVVARRERRIGAENLRIVLGDTHDARQRRAILRESFQTFALLLYDLFWFSRAPERRIPPRVEFEPSVADFFDHPRAVGVTAHFGNWEIMGQALALRGHPLLVVAKPLKNAAVNRILDRLRTTTDQSVTRHRGAVRRMLAVLRDGGRVGLLLDQNVAPDEGGIFVNFLGLPAPISTTAASLALRTESPVVLVFCRPDARGNYRAYSGGIVPPPPATDNDDARVAAFTQAIADRMAKAIRDDPGAWLWMYKRWKYVPPGADPGHYPVYARPWPPATTPSRPESRHSSE